VGLLQRDAGLIDRTEGFAAKGAEIRGKAGGFAADAGVAIGKAGGFPAKGNAIAVAANEGCS
jgi:hypothetical protein